MAEEQNEEIRKTVVKQRSVSGRLDAGLSTYVFGKLPPQARDLEEAILGAMMLEKGVIIPILNMLKMETFYVEAHGLVFNTIVNLVRRNDPVDLLTVIEELRRLGMLEKVGGAFAVTELTNRVTSAANVEYHARIVYQKFLQREAIKISTRTIEECYEDTTDVLDTLETTQKSYMDLTSVNKGVDVTRRGRLDKAVKVIKNAMLSEDHITGVPSGIKRLDDITGGWQPEDVITIGARPGMGKCLGRGTKVLMFNGELKCIEDIKINELIMGPDSRPRTVLSTTQGIGKMYLVHQRQGISYRINDKHILSLKRSRNDGGFKNGDILNIEVEDWLKKSNNFRSNWKGYKTDINFNGSMHKISPYFVGLWLGDGDKNGMRITSADREIDFYLQQFARACGLKLSKSPKKGTVAFEYRLSTGKRGGDSKRNNLLNIFKELNLIGNKHIPKHFFANEKFTRLGLLAGLIDSDGYRSPDNTYEITQKNKKLAYEIKLLADSLGFKTNMVEKRTTTSNTDYVGVAYRLTISGNTETIPCIIERKKVKSKQPNKNHRVTGITVIEDGIDEYFGFELSGDGLFLLEDMTVTHNSAMALKLALTAAKAGYNPYMFSLEMSETQFAMREIAEEMDMKYAWLRKGQVSQEQFDRILERLASMYEVPLFLDSTPRVNTMQFRTKLMYNIERNKTGLAILDYIQLHDGEKNVRQNTVDKITQIMADIKQTAKMFHIPIIVLSQLNRDLTKRVDKRPELADLKNSGAIEEYSDIVMFLNREAYYKKEMLDTDPDYNKMEINVAKHKQGGTGKFDVRCIIEKNIITDWEDPQNMLTSAEKEDLPF